MNWLMQRRRALMAEKDQTPDTTPVIAEYNKQFKTDGTTTTQPGYCVTKKYKVPWTKGMTYRFESGKTTDTKVICAWTITEDHFSTGWTRSLSGSFTTINVSYTFANCWLACTLAMDHIDNSYLYETTTGYIVYAGVNTPYFGKRNIND